MPLGGAERRDLRRFDVERKRGSATAQFERRTKLETE